MTAATLATLEEHGVTGTPSGAAALALAAKLDIGQDSGSAMAALARELRSTIDDALRSSSIRTDVVDELSARRRARVAGA